MRRQCSQKSFVGVVILLFATTLLAQPDTLWTKTFGGLEDDEARSVCETPDGGYIIAGYTESFGEGSSDFYLIRTDSEGNSLWTKTYGGEYRDGGWSVCLTSDGGYIIAGFTESFGTAEGSVYLIKTDADGDTLWTKKYGGADFDVAYCVRETSDSGYIITGYTESFGAGEFDVWLTKMDADGDTLWTRTYGGEGDEIGLSVCETSDGGYVIAGWTESFAVGFWDVYLVKTDADGDIMWTKTFGGTYIDVSISVQETPAGGYILAGHTYIRDGEDVHSDIYLIRTDTNGDSLWSRTWGGTSNEYGLSVGLTSDGGYIVAGSTQSFGTGGGDVWLLKVAPDVGIKEKNHSQKSLVLCQPQPNPFCAETSIEYQLSEETAVKIAVYDRLGRKVNTILDNRQNAGTHVAAWGGSDDAGKRVSSGVYFIKFEAGEERCTGKVVLMR